MKRSNSILAIILLVVVAGCGGGKQPTDDLITVDVRKNYPQKELILQDFLDVEYITLETNDDFVTEGRLYAVGKEIIAVSDVANGNILLFDRKTGKGIRKINHRGQGPGEYMTVLSIMLDEDNEELFAVDNGSQKIFVYDLYGKFKRSIQYAYNREIYIYKILNYDNNHLIFYDYSFVSNDIFGTNFLPSYNIMSKQNGNIIRKIQFPFEKIISPVVVIEVQMPSASAWYTLVPDHGNWILTEISSDTIYRFSPGDNRISPFIVRTPSIHSMDPGVLLYVSFLTDRYYFMETVKREYDRETRTYPFTDLVYDKQANEIFQFILYNDDYSVKTPINMRIRTTPLYPLKNGIAFWHKLESYQLVESYKKGELKGRLKEIAAELDEESNPVIMLVKHRK